MDKSMLEKLQEQAELMRLVHGPEIAMKLLVRDINREQDVTQRRILQVKLNLIKAAVEQ